MIQLTRTTSDTRRQIIGKINKRSVDKIINSCAIARLEFIQRPHHKTAVCILSRVANPDTVVVYTYGGLNPHHFKYNNQGEIIDNTINFPQFTWEWMELWLDQGVAVAIFDVPDYFVIPLYNISWVSSFYRLTNDRGNEAIQLLDMLVAQFPSAKINWFGISYGALDAAMIGDRDSPLYKIVSASATWNRNTEFDEYHQGARLNHYDVTTSKKPVLIIMHEKEVCSHARDQMTKTDSLLVTNDVSAEDGHFFRGRQSQVVQAICDWFRDKPIPKVIE